MKTYLAIAIFLSAALPCVAQQDSHHGSGKPAGAPAAPAAAPASATPPTAQYVIFQRALNGMAMKSGAAPAYEKYLAPDYTFIRTNKSVIDRAKFLADAKAGKLDRPLAGVDTPDMRSRTATIEGATLVVTTKTEQDYKQNYKMPNGTVAKGALVKRQLNVVETFQKQADGSFLLQKTDLSDLKLYVNGALQPNP